MTQPDPPPPYGPPAPPATNAWAPPPGGYGPPPPAGYGLPAPTGYGPLPGYGTSGYGPPGYGSLPGYGSPAAAGYRPAGPSPWAVVAAVFVGLWAVAVAVGSSAVGWLVDQVLLVSGMPLPAWTWPLIGVVGAALVAIPAGLLAVVPRSTGVRAAGRAWLVGAVLAGAFGLLRAVPMVHHEVYLAALAALAATGAAVLRRRRRNRPAPGPGTTASAVPGTTALPASGTTASAVPGTTALPASGTTASPAPGTTALPASGTTALAAAAGLAIAVPWLWVGALGGLTETALALVAAAALGWLAGVTLDSDFWRTYGAPGRRPDTAPDPGPHSTVDPGPHNTVDPGPYNTVDPGPHSTVDPGPYSTTDPGPHLAPGLRPARLVLLGGLVAGVALALLAAGIGQPGTQLAELLVLPPLGFAAAALHGPWLRATAHQAGAPGAAAVALLVGPAAAAPLALADPEEITLLLATGRDVPVWVALAAGASLAVGLLLAVGYALTLARRGTPRRWIGAATVGAVLVAAGVVYAGPGQPGLHGERLFVIMKEQADLSGVAATGTGGPARDARVAEVYRRLVSTAERSQADLRRDLDRWRLSYTPYYLVNGVEVDGGPAVRAWLSRRSDVDRVLLSQRLRPLPAAAGVTRGSASAPRGPAWNITMIGADRARDELRTDGSGISVGTSDSGVDGAHPALAGTFRGGDDSWYDPWNATRTPTDRGGHGTHTLGSAVGGNGVGVAPGARWVGCVNLDRNLGNPAHYLDCLQFMLAPFPAGGDPFTAGRPGRAPHVLTNSWSCPALEGCDAGALRAATAAFAAAGVFFVAAAGNTGPYCGSIDDPPAPYADVLTVGAVDRQRRVTEFSSRGPAAGGQVKPDVVAPGAGILSALPDGTYGVLDGTSMATPHVAGVVALMWSANPRLVGDLDRTRQILRQTATRATPTQPPGDASATCGQDANVTGAGLVDAYAAVRAAREVR